MDTSISGQYLTFTLDSGTFALDIGAVREVEEIPSSALLPPPRMGAAVDSEYLRAMGKRGADFVLILDPDRVFSLQELMAPSPALGTQGVAA